MTEQGGRLAVLPSEIVLKIIDYLPLPSIAALNRTSNAWHHFIEQTHQDRIYRSKADRPHADRDLAFLSQSESFLRYFDDITSWKQLCKKQFLLKKNWICDSPIVRESKIHTTNDEIWRFRPDFKNRWVMSTFHQGGIRVTDMDNGEKLWHLPADAVRQYAHLEYDEGWAAWDRWGNGIEIWKASNVPAKRGHFERVAILPHDYEIRGFHLVYPTLCVVSHEARGFVYDISQGLPILQTKLDIEPGASGHLYQDGEAVMYSMGVLGYHFHSKKNGQLLGVLHPKDCTTQVHHIRHPQSGVSHSPASTIRETPLVITSEPLQRQLVRLKLDSGPHSRHTADYVSQEDDEWGAGLLSGKIMVGVSRSGRVIVCSDWKEAIRSRECAAAVSTIIECEANPENFLLGGWLSFKHGRVIFEVDDRIYILTLPEDGVPFVHQPQPLFAAWLGPPERRNVSSSWMGVFDDCIMSTYADYTYSDEPIYLRDVPFSTKMIRVLSFTPDI
ncbi:MAG: hypothetical protein M1821_003249 [Bathelium mastoideum]|nr:MAG: hypothetical protein M1821_003249 [Bathelium mastoideum]KAI9689394.1 MAG: hypothetical protein M1822_010045 [Bathelium mastoideum]